MARIYQTSIAVFGSLMLLLALICTAEAASTSLRLRREVKQTPTDSHCPSSTPCGWAVYTPFSRNVDYFMQNTCSCSPEQKCIRTEDDLSISAYVYRCRVTGTVKSSKSS